jgi:hypothetical protein
VDWLVLGEDGYVNLRADVDTMESFTPFYQWEQTCCEHKNMEAARERISNWGGYRLFKEALEKVGWQHFPVLAKELPTANGGLMTPQASDAALLELDFFRQQPFIGKIATLVDSRSGYVIFRHIAAWKGAFIWNRYGVDAGVSECEFFIRDHNTGADLFRATQVRQTLLDPIDEHAAYSGRVQFTDIVTGTVFIARAVVLERPIPWPDGRMENDKRQIRSERLEEFHVEIRDQISADFKYILEPLTRVFQASVATGNPVRWC